MILPLFFLLLVLNPPTSPVQPTKNRVLVVFKRSTKTYTYSGTVDGFVMPNSLSEKGSLPFTKALPLPTSPTQQEYPYLLYMAKSGSILSFYYSPNIRQCKDSSGNRVLLPLLESTALHSQIEKAKPAPIQHHSIFVDGDYFAPPLLHLKYFCKATQYIVTGRVVGVLREASSDQYNVENSSRHTVFLVAIERYLKSSTENPPAVVKVRQVGGWYSLKAGDPLLGLGERYLLFLNLPPKPPRLKKDAVPTPGREQVIAYQDEMILMHPLYGQILLSKELAIVPETKYIDSAWGFKEGVQITNVREEQALKNIEDTLAQLIKP